MSIATRETAEGCEASLVVLDGNPAVDLARLDKPAMTIKEGVVAVSRWVQNRVR
ncbi:hypothetical protein [Sphingomonas sp.]